jgi:hypothetical protein
MPAHNGSDEFHHRASQIRLIAEGIFDKTERGLILQFVDDCERRFATDEREIAGDRT